jgi:hypothetical protein
MDDSPGSEHRREVKNQFRRQTNGKQIFDTHLTCEAGERGRMIEPENERLTKRAT